MSFMDDPFSILLIILKILKSQFESTHRFQDHEFKTAKVERIKEDHYRVRVMK